MANPVDSLRKDLTPEEFERFRDWIHHHSGIYLEESKVDSLRISLVTRATRLGFLEYDGYFQVLSTDEDEFKELMNLVTINETSFFRFPAQFDALRDLVIPEILETKARQSHAFRVWSAGCSTGEEPYSIAMTLLDSAITSKEMRAEVTGTDVSTQALDRAKAAVYPAKALASLPQNVVQRWFEPVKGGHRPRARARDLVSFAYHNLIKEPYPVVFASNWDLIFCRNVTIYFRPESTRRVVNNFYEALNPGGYLFIGHSETLTSISDRFEPLEVGGVFLYRKPLPGPSVFAPGLGVHPVRTERPRTVDLPRGAAKGASAPSTRPRVPVPQRTPRTTIAPVPVTADTPHTPDSPDAADGGGTEALVVEAHALLEGGDPARARSVADLALARDPRDIGALLARAHANADVGDMDAAVADATEALSINPLLASARYVLGIIRMQQDDAAGALTEFKRTLYIDPDFVLAHFNLANIHRASGAMDDACRGYENALSALRAAPHGEWTAFLGGFNPELLAKTCERSLIECRKGSSRR
ncbi:MAG: tetratricopeptide repeat protein [Coriobacteriia bacterium]|nr:tetratricopeptide repeat protein [Coriobacteriia bacterium]